ncbi:MAG: sigma-E processing peptidase SpoIIGA [Acutalibacteraceae bacterium]
MKQTVYVDVLLAVNFFINYFLILSAGKIMRREVSRTRICLAAAFGAVTALSIFLPQMGVISGSLFKLAVSAVMVLIAFKWQSARIFGRYFLVMCAVAFGFGGTMFAIWLMIAPRGMYFRNGVTYFNVPPEFIVVVTILCYTVITLAGRICGSRERKSARYNVTVCGNGHAVALSLVGDTGNMLSEPFSGYPVIVAKRNSVRKILPDDFENFTSDFHTKSNPEHPPNCRVIPYSSVGGSGILTAFLPDKIRLIQDGGSCEIEKCYIAVSDSLNCEEYDGIINPSVFEK